jgi:hypothetical protein
MGQVVKGSYTKGLTYYSAPIAQCNALPMHCVVNRQANE